MTGWMFWVGAVVVPLLVTELGGWAAWAAERLVRWAARRLGDPADTARYSEEFAATICRVPGQLSRLMAALSVVAYVPVLRRALTLSREQSSTQGWDPGGMCPACLEIAFLEHDPRDTP